MSTPIFSFNSGTKPATTTGGLFGSVTSTPATTSSQPSLFGSSTPAAGTTGGFGTLGAASAIKPATTASPFGAAVTTSPFGQQKPATGFGGFGQLTTTTPQPATNLFGTSTAANTTATTQQQQAQPAQQTSLLGNTTLNQTAAQQQQQPATLSDIDVLTAALSNANVYNDERDLILAKWNQLQAFFGFGKVFYQNQALDITRDSRLSRFKSISYNCRPTYKNEDGLVCLLIKKPETEVRANEKSICDTLLKSFNNDQSLSVKVEVIKPVAETNNTEFVFYVEQRVNPMTEEKTRVASTLVTAHLKKPEAASGSAFLTLKTTTSSKQLLEAAGVIDLYALVGLTEDQIKKYLDTPPIGFNPVLWDEAKKNNPNPKKLLPAQLTGFTEVNKRFKLQGQENDTQKAKLVKVNGQIDALNARNELIKTKIEQMKAQNEGLEQRIMKVIINYEIRRKIGLPIQDYERHLLNILNSFQIELNSPINKEIQRQRFAEFTESIKAIESSMSIKGKRQIEQQAVNQLRDMNNLGEVQKSLRDQQKAFKSLIEIINGDLKSLNLIRNSI